MGGERTRRKHLELGQDEKETPERERTKKAPREWRGQK